VAIDATPWRKLAPQTATEEVTVESRLRPDSGVRVVSIGDGIDSAS
jgi:hypothetical protein